MQLEVRLNSVVSPNTYTFQSLQDAIRRTGTLYWSISLARFNLYKMQLEVFMYRYGEV